MNFDKKLTEAFSEFKEYVSKKGPAAVKPVQTAPKAGKSSMGCYERAPDYMDA